MWLHLLLALLAFLLWFLNNRDPQPAVFGASPAPIEFGRGMEAVFQKLQETAMDAYYVGLRDGALACAIVLVVLYLLFKKSA